MLKPIRRKLLAIFVFAASLSAAQAETTRIAMLGDSLTQGYGLVAQNGLTRQLQEALNDTGAAIEIVNAGVSGDTTAGGLSRAAWTLTPDIDALIIALGGNDVLRGVAPEIAKENLAGIAEIAQAQGLPILFVGTTVPSNFGPAYKTEFEAIYPDLAEFFAAQYYPSLLAPLLETAPLSELLQTHFQRDGLHPNAKGVAILAAAFVPEVQELARRAAQ